MQACQGMTFDAMHTVNEALTSPARRPAAEAWALLALLLSAQSQHAIAINSVNSGVPGAQPELLRLLLKIKARALCSSGADSSFSCAFHDCLRELNPMN